MPAWLAPLIGAAGSIIGGTMQNAAQANLSREQMKFQERMSSTAHQREVADLRAAGLNPMLSAMGGGGASSPGGSMPSVENVISPALNSAMALKRMAADLKLTQSQTEKNEADRQYTTDIQANIGRRQEELLEAQRNRARTESEMAKLMLPLARFNAQWYGSKAGQQAESLKRLREMLWGGSTPLPH